jgi:hypothetical protein
MTKLYNEEHLSIQELLALRIPDKQGGYPPQWPEDDLLKKEFSHFYTDEYNRVIYEYYDGTRYSWQSWAHDFLPVLT